VPEDKATVTADGDVIEVLMPPDAAAKVRAFFAGEDVTYELIAAQ
jgi:hypothetical protein